MVGLATFDAPFSTSVFPLRAILPSAHGDDDANDSSGDSHHKRGENRASPDALLIEQRQKDKRCHRHAEHDIRAAGCRPD
jgi:hypothetical protein